MSVIKNKHTTVTYKVDKTSLKEIIAADLGIPANNLKLDYVVIETGDDRYGTSKEFSHINVTVVM